MQKLFKNAAWYNIAGLAFLLMGLFALYAFTIKPTVAGFSYDDGAYLLAAKALATGKGYTLPNIVGEPALVKYPPLLSVLLAPLWWVAPNFPNNIVLFKVVNSLLAVVFLGMLAIYCRRDLKLPVWFTLLLVAVTGLHNQFVFVATEIYAEPLYLVLSMGVIMLAGRVAWGRWPGFMALVLLMVLAVYARSVGMILLLATGGWLVFHAKKEWGGLFLPITVALALPWFWWSAGQPSLDMPFQVGGSDWLLRSLNETYLRSVETDLLYHYDWGGLYATGMGTLLGQWAGYFMPVIQWLPKPYDALNLLAGLGVATVFLLSVLQAVRQKRYTLMGLYCGLYAIVLPFWAYHDHYPRLFLAVLPFFWIILYRLTATWMKPKPQFAGYHSPLMITLLTLSIAGFGVMQWQHLQQVDRSRLLMSHQPQFMADFTDATAFVKERIPNNAENALWLSHLVMPYVLYTDQPVNDRFIQRLNADWDDTLPEDEQMKRLKELKQQAAAAHRKAWELQKAKWLVVSPQLQAGYLGQRVTPLMEAVVEGNQDILTRVYQSQPNGLISIYSITQ